MQAQNNICPENLYSLNNRKDNKIKETVDIPFWFLLFMKQF